MCRIYTTFRIMSEFAYLAEMAQYGGQQSTEIVPTENI